MNKQISTRIDHQQVPLSFEAGRAAATLLAPSSKNVLIVSPHFPPSTLAGVHRARHLARHLPAHGWRPIIIRADERHYTEAPDPALATLVPEHVEQIRTGAVPARLARLVGIGDIGIRAYWAFCRAIEAGIARYAPRAILITGSPYYPMLMASWIKRRWNIPVVLDFQDPWVCADGRDKPRWSKAGIGHQLSLALEPRAVRAADWITSVSDTQNAEMAARYPWLDGKRMSGIPIGGDPNDFAALRASSFRSSRVTLDPDRINLCYVGTFLPRAEPVVRAIFEAAARLRRERPELGKRLRFVFVGTSNQPDGVAVTGSAHLVTPIAAAAGIADMVYEHPARVSFFEALTILSRANGLMLLGSDEPHYTASKIYPALMSGTPYLSLFHRRSSSHEILTRAGGGTTYAFLEPAQLSEMVPEITNGLRRLAEEPDTLGYADPVTYAAYTAHAVAGRFAQVFNTVAP